MRVAGLAPAAAALRRLQRTRATSGWPCSWAAARRASPGSARWRVRSAVLQADDLPGLRLRRDHRRLRRTPAPGRHRARGAAHVAPLSRRRIGAARPAIAGGGHGPVPGTAPVLSCWRRTCSSASDCGARRGRWRRAHERCTAHRPVHRHRGRRHAVGLRGPGGTRRRARRRAQSRGRGHDAGGRARRLRRRGDHPEPVPGLPCGHGGLHADGAAVRGADGEPADQSGGHGTRAHPLWSRAVRLRGTQLPRPADRGHPCTAAALAARSAHFGTAVVPLRCRGVRIAAAVRPHRPRAHAQPARPQAARGRRIAGHRPFARSAGHLACAMSRCCSAVP